MRNLFLSLLALALLPAMSFAAFSVQIEPAHTKVGIAKVGLHISSAEFSEGALHASAVIKAPFGAGTKGKFVLPIPAAAIASAQPFTVRGTFTDVDNEQFPFTCYLTPSNDSSGRITIEITTSKRELSFESTYSVERDLHAFL